MSRGPVVAEPHPPLLRAALGAGLLLRPAAVAPLLGLPAEGDHPVLRVLGLRHLVQALALLRWRSRTALTVSAAVDTLHASSCVALALVDRGRRAPALRDGAVAGSFALWGGVRAYRGQRGH